MFNLLTTPPPPPVLWRHHCTAGCRGRGSSFCMAVTVHKQHDPKRNKYHCVPGDWKGYKSEAPNKSCVTNGSK